MDETEKTTEIDGTVLSVVYRNEENGYTVLRLKTQEGTVTVVGTLPGVTAGEGLTLSGSWSSHPSYGDQFRAESFFHRLPTGKRAILEYLCCGAVKGVGPALAAAIVNAFGDDTLDVLTDSPERLAEVKGISPKKAREIGEGFRRRTAVRLLMEFLTENGLSPVYALKLYQVYGPEALTAVRANPYLLTHEYYGADFFEADKFAESLGFGDDSPERIEAAALFELRHNLHNGHTFLPREKLTAATAQLISLSPEAVSDAVDRLLAMGEAVRETIAGQDAIYLSQLYEAETYTADRLLAMAGSRYDAYKRTDDLIDAIERKQGIVYAEKQREAVAAAAEHGLVVLTGGPGTGKTTSLLGIISLFDRMGLETALTAPTGRAAKRMSELTGREAMTIHRLLGASGAGGTEPAFSHDESDPLEADAVIVDETSMVDILLMRALLSALKPGCRLVLTGDADQLPSVGPGNVFSDIIRSGAAPVIRLTEIFRQAEKSAIVRTAHEINGGVIPAPREGDGDFFFLRRPTKERAAETIVELASLRLPKNMGIPPEQIQVLSPTRKGECGTEKLNRLLQEAINPPSEGKRERPVGKNILREGDRVMQTRNNYDIIWKSYDGHAQGEGVFNGDVGLVLSVDTQAETVTVDFDGRLAVYSFDMLYELEPAFAMTVHKSQGSEYRAVVLAVTREAPVLMTRSVLYTAVTRARELLILVGDQEAPAEMTRNDRRARRYSGLKTRLSQGAST